MNEAGRQQLWQQQFEEKQSGGSQSEGAGQKTEKTEKTAKREGGRGDGRGTERGRERESSYNTDAPAIRLGCSICIREGHSGNSNSPLLSTRLVNGPYFMARESDTHTSMQLWHGAQLLCCALTCSCFPSSCHFTSTKPGIFEERKYGHMVI